MPREEGGRPELTQFFSQYLLDLFYILETVICISCINSIKESQFRNSAVQVPHSTDDEIEI